MEKIGILESMQKTGDGTNAKGRWERWELVIDGKKYSTFDSAIYENEFLESGVEVVYEIEMKGKFWNLKSCKPKMPLKRAAGNEPVNAPIVRPEASNEGKKAVVQEYHLSIEESRARALEASLKIYELNEISPTTEMIQATAALFLKFILGEKKDGN